MKIGEDGYWEREDRHDRETARVRETAKEAVAFYLTIEALQSEGIDIPKNLIRWSGDSLNDLKVAREIGALITQAKGLGLDSVSPELKKELLKQRVKGYVYRSGVFVQQNGQREKESFG